MAVADQVTVYRQPTLARAYWLACRHSQPLGRCSHRPNTRWRIAGLLNASSGKETFV